MEYVYKYMNNNRVIYVGITNNMKKRVCTHTRDKLANEHDSTIYYFPVKYRADAELLETYLINYYKTKDFYNVAKTRKGDVSFLDICEKLPWHIFTGVTDKSLEPFVVSSVVNTITKPVYVDTTTESGRVEYVQQCIIEEKEKVNDLIAFEQDFLSTIAKIPEQYYTDFIIKGIRLHKKRLKCAMLLRKYPGDMNEMIHCNHKYFARRDRLADILGHVKHEIDMHEGRVDYA